MRKALWRTRARLGAHSYTTACLVALPQFLAVAPPQHSTAPARPHTCQSAMLPSPHPRSPIGGTAPGTERTWPAWAAPLLPSPLLLFRKDDTNLCICYDMAHALNTESVEHSRTHGGSSRMAGLPTGLSWQAGLATNASTNSQPSGTPRYRDNHSLLTRLAITIVQPVASRRRRRTRDGSLT